METKGQGRGIVGLHVEPIIRLQQEKEKVSGKSLGGGEFVGRDRRGTFTEKKKGIACSSGRRRVFSLWTGKRSGQPNRQSIAAEPKEDGNAKREKHTRGRK